MVPFGVWRYEHKLKCMCLFSMMIGVEVFVSLLVNDDVVIVVYETRSEHNLKLLQNTHSNG